MIFPKQEEKAMNTNLVVATVHPRWLADPTRPTDVNEYNARRRVHSVLASTYPPRDNVVTDVPFARSRRVSAPAIMIEHLNEVAQIEREAFAAAHKRPE